MNELALFAGAGGGILGGHLLGWRCVCAVELDPYARSVLLARQDDGTLPPFPIWDDVCTFDGRPWRGAVDVVSGGFPCQDISVAGKGAGIDGARSGLWREMARIIGEVEPAHVLVENSPALVGRGLGVVLGDLAAMGFDAKWGVLGADTCGAPHERERLWVVASHPDRVGCDEDGRGHWRPIPDSKRVSEASPQGRRVKQLWPVANPDRLRQPQPQGCKQDERGRVGDSGQEAPDAASDRCDARRLPQRESETPAVASGGGWWAAEPDVARMVHGVASRVDRVRALGNGQVPAVVRLAWGVLK